MPTTNEDTRLLEVLLRGLDADDPHRKLSAGPEQALGRDSDGRVWVMDAGEQEPCFWMPWEVLGYVEDPLWRELVNARKARGSALLIELRCFAPEQAQRKAMAVKDKDAADVRIVAAISDILKRDWLEVDQVLLRKQSFLRNSQGDADAPAD